MLLPLIDNYINKTAASRIMISANNYIKMINTRRSLVLERYNNQEGIESSPGVQLLKRIIEYVDTDYLLKNSDDVSNYINYLADLKPELDSLFDQVYINKIYTNIFIKSDKVKCSEYIIPIYCTDYLSQLPFNQSWDYWSTLSPVRILDTDSRELTFLTITDQVVYRKSMPTRAIIGIDVIMLILQCVNYLRTDQSVELYAYLHHHVLSGFLIDLENLWLRNLYTDRMKVKLYNMHASVTDFYGIQGIQYDSFIYDTDKLIGNCRDMSISSDVFLNSLRLSDTSVIEYLVDDYLPSTNLPALRQYRWLDYLKEASWIDLILSSYALQPDMVATRNLKKTLKRVLQITKNTKFWTFCHDINVRDYIQENLDDLLIRVLSL
jgi:hypothetical protein